MAAIEFRDIFGTNYYTNFDTDGNWYECVFVLNDFMNVEEDGEIQNNLGISDLIIEQGAGYQSGGEKAVKVFYGLMLMLMQKQAAGKNDDPEQKIYIEEAGSSIINFGNRSGQLERRFTVSIFSSGDYGNTTDIDSI